MMSSPLPLIFFFLWIIIIDGGVDGPLRATHTSGWATHEPGVPRRSLLLDAAAWNTVGRAPPRAGLIFAAVTAAIRGRAPSPRHPPLSRAPRVQQRPRCFGPAAAAPLLLLFLSRPCPHRMSALAEAKELRSAADATALMLAFHEHARSRADFAPRAAPDPLPVHSSAHASDVDDFFARGRTCSVDHRARDFAMEGCVRLQSSTMLYQAQP
jgi:hypothetical protein